MGISKRISWIDSAKGISIILVVMLYAANSVGKITGEIGFLHYIIGFAMPFRMPEFFLISGLFLSNVIARDWKTYLDRRFVHYLYFYALWALIIIIMKVGIFSMHPSHALSLIAWSIVEPYSLLWFIYVLAFFSLAAKIAFSLKIPHWAMLGFAAILQILDVQTPSYAVNQFAEYLIYFYAGYVFAPYIFKLMTYFEDRAMQAIYVLSGFVIINAAFVFLPTYSINPSSFEMGLASLPVIHLILALVGALAVCLSATLFAKIKFMTWLSYIGKNSIIIFLAFSLPMGFSREILFKFGIITDTGILSLVILLIAIISPLILFWLTKKTGYGKFLFTRPEWAHIPGVPGSLNPKIKLNKIPAE